MFQKTGGTSPEMRSYSCKDIIFVKCFKTGGRGHFVQSSLVNNTNEDERQDPDHRCGPKMVRGTMNSCSPKLPSPFNMFAKIVISSFEKQKNTGFYYKFCVLRLIFTK